MEATPFADISLVSGRTLQAQLYQHLVAKINSGQLPPGTRLPSSRRVAHELGISRNTVTELIDQLKSEGFVISRAGSGVFINEELPSQGVGLASLNRSSRSDSPKLSTFGQRLNQSVGAESDLGLAFTPGVPDLNAFAQKTWHKIQRHHQDRVSLRGFGCVQGYGPLRDALAHYLQISRGVRCTPEKIIITQGAQEALMLCAQVLLNEGDGVFMENPGYRRAHSVFMSRNARIHSVPVGSDGLEVSQLPQHTTTKLMYTTPTHQYPLGGILSATHRLKLLDWASKNKLWIIEDDYDSEFHFYGKPIVALQGMAVQAPVLYVGSFSKTLFPALRLGYLVVPEQLVSTFVQAKSCLSGESPLLTQATVADFLTEGHFVRHVRRMRHLYQKKWEHTEALIKTHLSGLATPVAESAGMHLVIKTKNIDDKKLAAQFLKAGFGSTPLSDYHNPNDTKAAPMTGLVLGFANTTEQQREVGILKLKGLIKKLQVQ